MISYEISLGAVILSVLVLSRTLNFSDIVESQRNV
jgi:NADH:ubiquinone oxidoreductase subunit H